MLVEARYQISIVLNNLEKKLEKKSDIEKVRGLKKKVEKLMYKYDSLQKWEQYKAKSKEEIAYLISEFDALEESYPEVSNAKFYFKHPAFFNED